MHGTGTISAVAIVMKASGFSFVLMTRSRIRAWTGKVVRGQLGLRAGASTRAI